MLPRKRPRRAKAKPPSRPAELPPPASPAASADRVDPDRPHVVEAVKVSAEEMGAEFTRLTARRALARLRAGKPYQIGEVLSDGNIEAFPWHETAEALEGLAADASPPRRQGVLDRRGRPIRFGSIVEDADNGEGPGRVLYVHDDAVVYRLGCGRVTFQTPLMLTVFRDPGTDPEARAQEAIELARAAVRLHGLFDRAMDATPPEQMDGFERDMGKKFHALIDDLWELVRQRTVIADELAAEEVTSGAGAAARGEGVRGA